MTIQKLTELLSTEEPLLRFHNIDYQILFLQKQYLIAVGSDETKNLWFYNLDDLLANWAPDGIPLKQAITDIKRIWYADLN